MDRLGRCLGRRTAQDMAPAPKAQAGTPPIQSELVVPGTQRPSEEGAAPACLGLGGYLGVRPVFIIGPGVGSGGQPVRSDPCTSGRAGGFWVVGAQSAVTLSLPPVLQNSGTSSLGFAIRSSLYPWARLPLHSWDLGLWGQSPASLLSGLACDRSAMQPCTWQSPGAQCHLQVPLDTWRETACPQSQPAGSRSAATG